jgi:hypothetical protein
MVQMVGDPQCHAGRQLDDERPVLSAADRDGHLRAGFWFDHAD